MRKAEDAAALGVRVVQEAAPELLLSVPDHYHKLAAGVPLVDPGTTKEISEGKRVNFDVAGYQHSWLGSAVGVFGIRLVWASRIRGRAYACMLCLSISF